MKQFELKRWVMKLKFVKINTWGTEWCTPSLSQMVRKKMTCYRWRVKLRILKRGLERQPTLKSHFPHYFLQTQVIRITFLLFKEKYSLICNDFFKFLEILKLNSVRFQKLFEMTQLLELTVVKIKRLQNKT